MNNKTMRSIFAFALCAAIMVSVCAFAEDGVGKNSPDTYLEMMAAEAAAVSDAETFGGYYYNDNNQLVYCVKGPVQQKVPAALLSSAGRDIIFKSVKHSLSELEAMKKALIPYMSEYGIVLLDANERINKVTIKVRNHAEELSMLLSAMFDADDYEIVEVGNDFDVSFTILPVENIAADTRSESESGQPQTSALYPGMR